MSTERTCSRLGVSSIFATSSSNAWLTATLALALVSTKSVPFCATCQAAASSDVGQKVCIRVRACHVVLSQQVRLKPSVKLVPDL